MGVINALKLGWRSLGDDAARAAFGREAAEAIRSSKIKNAASTMNAQQLAAAMPEIEKYGVDFLNDFHSAYKQPVFKSGAEDLAYGVSRKMGGVAGGANQMVQGMGGIPGVALQAAFIAPMFMGGMGQPQQEQYTPEEIEMIRRQQQQQQGQYQQ